MNVTTSRRHVGAAICRPLRCGYNPCGQNGTTHRHVIPRERMRVEGSSRVASFILCWFIIQRGGFLHSADAPVGMTFSVRFYGFAHCFYSISRRPAALIRLALGRASFPRGKLLFRIGGLRLKSDGDIPGRSPERHTGRSLRFCWRVYF